MSMRSKFTPQRSFKILAIPTVKDAEDERPELRGRLPSTKLDTGNLGNWGLSHMVDTTTRCISHYSICRVFLTLTRIRSYTRVPFEREFGMFDPCRFKQRR
jgi:hypothetical protein